jgi:hypothetical protein
MIKIIMMINKVYMTYSHQSKLLPENNQTQFYRIRDFKS